MVCAFIVSQHVIKDSNTSFCLSVCLGVEGIGKTLNQNSVLGQPIVIRYGKKGGHLVFASSTVPYHTVWEAEEANFEKITCSGSPGVGCPIPVLSGSPALLVGEFRMSSRNVAFET